MPLVLAISFYPCLSVAKGAVNDSASPMAHPLVHPMTLQPQTSINHDDTKTYVVSATDRSDFACPSGYALTKIDQAPQKTKHVTVYRKCDGIASGYAFVWCHLSPETTTSVTEAPEVTYTCQKIVNAWTG